MGFWASGWCFPMANNLSCGVYRFKRLIEVVCCLLFKFGIRYIEGGDRLEALDGIELYGCKWGFERVAGVAIDAYNKTLIC